MRPLFLLLAAGALLAPPVWATKTPILAHQHGAGQPAPVSATGRWYCRRCRVHADHGGRCVDCGQLMVPSPHAASPVPHWDTYAKDHPYHCGRCRHWFDHGGRCPDCSSPLTRRARPGAPVAHVAPRVPRQAQRLPAFHCSRCTATSDTPGRCHDCGAPLVRYHVWAHEHGSAHHGPPSPQPPRHGAGGRHPAKASHDAGHEPTPGTAHLRAPKATEPTTPSHP